MVERVASFRKIGVTLVRCVKMKVFSFERRTKTVIRARRCSPSKVTFAKTLRNHRTRGVATQQNRQINKSFNCFNTIRFVSSNVYKFPVGSKRGGHFENRTLDPLRNQNIVSQWPTVAPLDDIPLRHLCQPCWPTWPAAVYCQPFVGFELRTHSEKNEKSKPKPNATHMVGPPFVARRIDIMCFQTKQRVEKKDDPHPICGRESIPGMFQETSNFNNRTYGCTLPRLFSTFATCARAGSAIFVVVVFFQCEARTASCQTNGTD